MFLDGSATPAIPRSMHSLKRSAFEHGTADAAAPHGTDDGRMVSNMNEVYTWLLQFGSGRQLWGNCLSLRLRIGAR